jgi:hypothetical protein
VNKFDQWAGTHPYALLPSSFKLSDVNVRADGSEYWHGYVGAIWFKKRNSRLYVTIGTLSHGGSNDPKDYDDFVARWDDGRYGGSPIAQWDGEKLWTPAPVTKWEADMYVDTLTPLHNHFPYLPVDYDGWYDIR